MPFAGRIGRTIADSEPSFEQRTHPGEDAPNVVLVLLDDLALYMRMISPIGPSVGGDHGSAVSARYAAPYEFTGTLHQIVVQASPEKYADVGTADARAEMSRQ